VTSQSPAELASRMVEQWLRRAADRGDMPDFVPHDILTQTAVRMELERLADILAARPAFHVIDFAEHGWTIMHPLFGCGFDLFNCPINEAAERGLERPDRYARFRCDQINGRLVLGEEVAS
jgi:hypothetical protein